MHRDLCGYRFADRHWRFSQTRARALASALDYPQTDVLPPTLAFSAELDGGIVDQMLSLTGLGAHQLLHGEQHFVYHRPLQPEQDYLVSGHISQVQRKGSLQLWRKDTLLEDDQGRRVCAMRSIYVGLDNPTGPGQAQPLQSESAPLATGPRLDAARIAAFARASGDLNRVHLDSEVARQAGHADVFAQGMLGMGLLGGLLLGEPLRAFGVRFVAPLPVNEQPLLYRLSRTDTPLLLTSAEGLLRVKGYADTVT